MAIGRKPEDVMSERGGGLSRRGLGALALAGLARPAFAEGFPARPIQVVVPFAAGGGAGRAAETRLPRGILAEPSPIASTHLSSSVTGPKRPGRCLDARLDEVRHKSKATAQMQR